MNRFLKLTSWCAVSVLSAALAGEAAAAPHKGGGKPAASHDEDGPKAAPAGKSHKGGPQKGGKKPGGKKPGGKHGKRPHKPLAPAVKFVASVVKNLSSAKKSATDDSLGVAFTESCVAMELLREDRAEHRAESGKGGKGEKPAGKPAHHGTKAKTAAKPGKKGPSKKGANVSRPCVDENGEQVATKEKAAELEAELTKDAGELATGKRGVAVALALRACKAAQGVVSTIKCELPSDLKAEVADDVKKISSKTIAEAEKTLEPVADESAAATTTEAAKESTEATSADAQDAKASEGEESEESEQTES